MLLKVSVQAARSASITVRRAAFTTTASTIFPSTLLQTIAQELEPIVLDVEQAASLSTKVGSPAMLVKRWYYLDDEVILLISRSVYPRARLPFRKDAAPRRGVSDTGRRYE